MKIFGDSKGAWIFKRNLKKTQAGFLGIYHLGTQIKRLYTSVQIQNINSFKIMVNGRNSPQISILKPERPKHCSGFQVFVKEPPSGLCTLILTEGSQIVPYSVKKHSRYYQYLLSNLYKMTTIETTQKWSSWVGGCLIKHLHKTATKQMQPSLAGF